MLKKKKNQNEISPHTSKNGYHKKRENVGIDAEKRETMCTAGGNVNWYSHSGKQYGISSKN